MTSLEEALREAVSRMLQGGGYQVITAADGPQALDVARSHSGAIDLLLTDVVMPHMLGKDLADGLQAVRPDVRVLFTSGYAQQIQGGTGQIEPGVLLVEKPFSAVGLTAKVREVLDRQD